MIDDINGANDDTVRMDSQPRIWWSCYFTFCPSNKPEFPLVLLIFLAVLSLLCKHQAGSGSWVKLSLRGNADVVS